MKKSDIYIKKITRAGKLELSGMNALLRQWSATSHPMTLAYFKKLIKKSYILGLYDGDIMIGTATLIPLYKLSGLKGSVEHVMIDEKYRGQGLGKKLMEAVIDLARELKMSRLVLTCEPERTAALALYKKVGFKIKDTGFYQLSL